MSSTLSHGCQDSQFIQSIAIASGSLLELNISVARGLCQGSVQGISLLQTMTVLTLAELNLILTNEYRKTRSPGADKL